MTTRVTAHTDETLTEDLALSAPSPRWYRIATSNIVLGVVLALLVWPYGTSSLTVLPGLDPSWQTALTMAAHNGIPFGTHIVFTYGPLGFLQAQQLNYLWTTVVDVLFALGLSTAVLATLVWSLRHVVPLIVAVAVAYAVGVVTIQHYGVAPEYVLALVLVVSVSILSRAGTDQVPGWAWIVLGGVFSVFGLVKISLGVGIAVALLVTIAFLPHGRWRALGGLVVGAVPTFCLGWFGTGNGLGNIGAFAKGSVAIISGYAPAMADETTSRFYAYFLLVPAVGVIGAFAFAFVRGRRLPQRAVIGIGVVTLVIVWLLFKEGFVRHDAHDLVFFAAAPVILVAFPPNRRPWVLVPGVLLLTGVFLIAAIDYPAPVPQPISAVRNFGTEVATIASPARRAGVIDDSRRSLRAGYALPERMVAMMQGQTVDISPWEQTVAWAYPRIRFDPLPVIQNYSAYTSSLDRLDTSYLSSSDAPRFILAQPGLNLDNRNPAFDPPATQVAIECRYRQVAGNASWELLERGPNRCGPPIPVGVVTTGYRHWVSVPTAPPGDAIVARFQLSQGWLNGLEAIAFKPPNVLMGYVSGHQHGAFRFVVATGPDLHLLQPALTLGYSGQFTPDSVSKLRFAIVGGNRSPSGVKVSFYRVRVAPVAVGPGRVLPTFTTTLDTPANGATLSGIVALDAMTSGYVGAGELEFRVTGPSENDALIDVGYRTLVGWLGAWNTSTVANGTYSLQSVAYDAIGRISRSNTMTVTVDNKSG
jgi:uncharacterized membrane protein YciS (DUF1049 family)